MVIGLMLFCLCGTAAARPAIPYNVTLASTESSITVNWTGDMDATGYYVYYGESSGNLDQRLTVTGTATQETISDLNPGTTYYVAVSAYDNTGESNRSEIKSIATKKDVGKPAVPTGLSVTSVGAITETAVTLKWNKNTDPDLDHYNIYYSLTSGGTDNAATAKNEDAASFTVTGLATASRYYISISATDDAENESEKSKPLVVDTLPDTRPPFTPTRVSGELSDINAITITISSDNAQMADFAGNILYYGQTSGNLDQEVDLGAGSTHTLTNLEVNSTWYFSAISYDAGGNRSERSEEGSAVVEEAIRYLNQPEDFDGGCFIQAGREPPDAPKSTGFRPMLLFSMTAAALALRRFWKSLAGALLAIALLAASSFGGDAEPLGLNVIGVCGAYYLPSDSDFTDFYGNDTLLVTAFYERRLAHWVSVDIESGFLQERGHLLTRSGAETRIQSKFTLIPMAASVNAFYQVWPFVTGYFGVGPDYWYCREDMTREDVFPEVEEWVAGCHAKAGVKLYNTDEDYRNTGALIETGYAWMDGFGQNHTDIGGFIFKFGLFYQF